MVYAHPGMVGAQYITPPHLGQPPLMPADCGMQGSPQCSPTVTEAHNYRQMMPMYAEAPNHVSVTPPEGATVRDSTQLGGPMKAVVSEPRSVTALSPSEYDRVLDMSTTEFNRFLKLSNISQSDVIELRKARRRKKNRLYAKRSRGKKLAKLLELQATVTQLSYAVSSTSPGGGTLSPDSVSSATPELSDHVDDDEDDGHPTNTPVFRADGAEPATTPLLSAARRETSVPSTC